MSWRKHGFTFNDWVDRMRRSRRGILKDHLFLGTSIWTGEPVALPYSLLAEHFWVTGSSGGGKSAALLAPFAAQIADTRKRSLVFIDQKGDLPSYWNCFDLATENRLPFKYFSTVPGQTSFIYNPFRQSFLSRLTPSQKTELFTQSAGMDHGDEYGAAYFLGKAELVFWTYLTHYKTLDNFVSLYKVFNDKASFAGIGNLSDWEDASHLRSLFARLGSISPLNATTSTIPNRPQALESAIDVSDLLRTPSIYYFNLPASVGRNAARFIARNVLQNLFVAAGLRASEESVPVVIICDEFQETVGPSVGLLLEQGRSRGLSFVLAHQSIEQLDRNSAKLLPTLQSCMSTHIVADAIDEKSVKYVQMRSGEAIYGLTSWSQPAPCDESPQGILGSLLAPWRAVSADGISPATMNVREEIRPRIDTNLVSKISADPTAAFVAIKKNKDLANFDGFMFPMRAYFHIDQKLFAARNNEPWPTWDRPETVIVELSNPLAPGTAQAESPQSTPDIKIVPPPPNVDSSLQDRLKGHKRNERNDQQRRQS